MSVESALGLGLWAPEAIDNTPGRAIRSNGMGFPFVGVACRNPLTGAGQAG